MAYILDISGDVSNPEEFRATQKFLAAYDEYLRALGDRLPESVRQFILAPWYRDSESHQCSYDAWLESARIFELATGSRHELRQLGVEIRLLGPYHDGHILYTYERVVNYSMVLPVVNERRNNTAHDGWQLDEIRLSPSNNVIHEIVWKSGARWLIEAASIAHSWIPITQDNS